MANAMSTAHRLDLLEGTVRVVSAGVDAKSDEAMANRPNVQIVNIGHSGNRRDVAVDVVPVHVGRYLLQQYRDTAANHTDGRIENHHTKQDGANGIDGTPLRLAPDGQTGNEDGHRLGQVAQHVDVCRVQIDVALLLSVMLVLDLGVGVRNLVGVQPLRHPRRRRRPIRCLRMGTIPFGRLGHVGKEQTLLLAAAGVIGIAPATTAAATTATSMVVMTVRMSMLVFVGMSMITTGQMDVMLSQHKGQDDIDNNPDEGNETHQSPIDVQIMINVGLFSRCPPHDEGPKTSDTLDQQEYRHDGQRGHGKQRRQRLGAFEPKGKVGAGG